MTDTTIAELADAATHGDRDGAIEFVLGCLSGRPDDQAEFLRGLSERIIQSDHPAGEGEIARWLGSWILSCLLESDVHFIAADSEASKLIAAGKVGGGVSTQELRQRYRR